MSIPQAKLREVLFLFMYAQDISSVDNSYELSELIMEELKVARSAVRQIKEIAEAIDLSRPIIDSKITSVLNEYRIERLQTVERTILRLAVHELLNIPDLSAKAAHEKLPLPPKVVIAEAKRLAKKFATPQAASFIHAVVVAIAKAHGLIDDAVDEEAKSSLTLSQTIQDLESQRKEEEEIKLSQEQAPSPLSSLQLE